MGGTRTFSNRYHFNGGVPPDLTHWTALANAIIAAEKAIYSSRVSIVEATCYLAGSDLPLFTISYSTAGTFVPGSGGRISPGDCAKVGVWLTTARSTKNHPVFLFSYWHDVYSDTAATVDEIDPTQRSAYHTYMSSWVSGFSDGATTYVRAGPNGATGYDFKTPAPDYITHRDFPR